MKIRDPVKFEEEAALHLENLLSEIPSSRIEKSSPGSQSAALPKFDFVFTVHTHGHTNKLLCEVKTNGQPRIVREAATRLRFECGEFGKNAYGVVIAPYLSQASQKICKELGVGFADLEGNCRIAFDGVYIDRLVATKPTAERRDLRSLFAPKSAQILRILMRDPMRTWRVAELAEGAAVSIGHVSNVRHALIEREWGKADLDGFYLTKPANLLDTWREAYRRPGKRWTFYTPMHGSALQSVMTKLMQEASERAQIAYASFSAARWLAPYARNVAEYIYADSKGLEFLRQRLELSSATKGENMTIWEVEDKGFYRDAIQDDPGIRLTSPVQTYLDLWISGERGREAAGHLRELRLKGIL